MTKKILLGLGVVLVIIQFIQPTRNVSTSASANEISLHYAVPAEVQSILKQSCNNCHSNTPVSWWLQSHVNDGKRHLNFEEFGSYPEKKAKHKFEEIEDAVTEGWMPLKSYLILHADAKLTPDQAKVVAEWASSLK